MRLYHSYIIYYVKIRNSTLILIACPTALFLFEEIKGTGVVILDDLLLWIFAGCYTRNTSSTYGNLLTRAAGKGVDCVVGFTSELNAPNANCI